MIIKEKPFYEKISYLTRNLMEIAASEAAREAYEDSNAWPIIAKSALDAAFKVLSERQILLGDDPLEKANYCPE